MKTRLASLLLVCLTSLPAVRADEWPQWRGPNRDDVSKEKGLLKTWPKDGPKLLWTYKEAGAGYSGPAIVGKTLYTMGAEGKKEYVIAIDVEKGKKLWSAEVGPLYSDERGEGPRCTPTVDGDLVYALGGAGDLVCVKTDGEKVWHTSLKGDLGGNHQSRWGYSESPLVDGDKVICMPGGDKGTLAALDKKKGTVLWRSKDLKDAAPYSSIVPATIAGMRQYVVMTPDHVAGVAAADGRRLWEYARKANTAAVPTPIVRENLVYVTSGYKSGCSLVKVTADSKNFRADAVYDNKSTEKNMVNHHGGVVLVGDFLYGYSGGNEAGTHAWICQDFKTGELKWEETDKKKLEKGSVTFADGHLYLYGESTGTAVLLEADPKEWKETGRFKLPEKSKEHHNYWTHPVVANGRLYLRDEELIFCYDIKDTN
jgi:outer membrane protein assembly factor BamB